MREIKKKESDTTREWILATSPIGVIQAVTAMMNRVDSSVTLDKIEVPSLIITGKGNFTSFDLIDEKSRGSDNRTNCHETFERRDQK
jgi:hypothetical protein